MRFSVLVALGCALLVGGCSSSDPGSPPASAAASTTVATTPSGPPDPHAAFDPCKDITDEWLKREGFTNRREPDDATADNIVFQGCVFVLNDGYGVIISTARNLTLDRARAKSVITPQDFRAANRPALSYEQLGWKTGARRRWR
jgi:hypothetical protein